MKKVLIIAFYFNQTNEIASKRLRGIAKYLPNYGWEPIIITPKFDQIDYNIDIDNDHNNNNNNNSNNNSNFKIIETEYVDMLDKWINKFSFSNNTNININNNINTNINNNIIKNTNNNTNNINNTNNTNNPNISADINNTNNTTTINNTIDYNKNDIDINGKILNKLISIAGEVFAYPDGMKYWYKPAMDASREIIENQKDDCEIKAIISSSWPITSHIIAKDLKIQYNIPWIADLRDLWNLNPYISHTFIRNYFEKKLEKNTFKYADALTTTTDLAAETLKTLHPTKKILPILSGFDLEDVASKKVYSGDVTSGEVVSEEIASGDVTSGDIVSKDMTLKNHIDINDDKLNFIYGGSLYDGKRDPTFLFKALSQLIAEKKVDSSKIAIDFYGDSGNLEKIAKKYELNNIINIYGRVPHKKLIEKQKKADVLLLLSWNNPNEKMFLPGKIYEYLAIKSPILSIGYKEGSLKDLIEKTNIGFHVSDLNQTKIAILKFYNEFIKKGKLNYSGNNEVNSYSLLNTSEKFANLLNSIQNKQ